MSQPRTAEEIRNLAEAAGLGAFADVLADASHPSVRLLARPADEGTIPLGSTKVGGQPDLPASIRWPDSDGRPISFILQVNLQDLRATACADKLPPSGLLSVFYDAVEQPWDSGVGLGWDLVYSPRNPEGLERKGSPSNLGVDEQFTPCAVELVQELSLPGLGSPVSYRLMDEKAYDRYFDLRGPLQEAPGQHRVLGYADAIQDDMQMSAYERLSNTTLPMEHTSSLWVSDDPLVIRAREEIWDYGLLLQVDSYEPGGMMWGDLGRIYFYSRLSNVRRGDFRATWMFHDNY